jgi:hypothetical protein
MGLLGSQQQKTERFAGIRTNQSILGAVIPILLGQQRLPGRLIWYGDFTSNVAKQQGGKGLGKGGSQYVYTASVVVLLAQGAINYLLNVYDSNGRFLLFSASEPYTIPGGGGTYTVANAAIYGNDMGAGIQAAYSVGANDYGSPGPVTLTGTQNVPMTPVSSSPGTGQYVVNPATGAYTFSAADGGKSVVISYSYYRYLIVTEEDNIVPFSGPYTITVNNSVNFKSDQGVAYYPSGTALVKVGSSPATGQYTVSGSGVYTFASGDSGNAVVISYEYNDPNTDNNAPNKLSMTLFNGALGQAPWSYLTGKHPSLALGYSQTAYIASQGLYLGFTPELPQYSFELAGAFQVGGGIVDVNPADAITSILTDPGFGIGFPAQYLGSLTLARQCFAANSFFISPALENQEACASVVGEWLESGMLAAFWSEGLLKFVPYGDTTVVGNGVTYSPPTTPVANLNDSNFIAESEDPVTVARAPWQDAYNRVQVGYSARVNDYNPEICYEQDESAIQRFGLRLEDPVQWDFITTLAAAQYAASMRVQRSVYIRNTYTFKLPSSFAYLEPMDVVTLTDAALGLNFTPVRIQKIDDDPVKGLDITAEDFLWGAAQPAYNPKSVNSPYTPDQGHQDPGNTNAIIFEATNRLGLQAGNILYAFLNGSNPNWGGCTVWVSFDGTNYAEYARITQPGRVGELTNSLPSFSGTNPDTADTLTVNMLDPGAALASTTSAGAAANVSLCAVVTAANVLELLSYETATLNGPNQYALTTLYRGVYGTSGIAHAAGELFARLDQASFQYQYDPTYYGKTIFFKFTSFNLLGLNEQSLSAVTASSFVLQGVGKGMIDLILGTVLSTTGSVPATLNGGFTYTSTTSSITWSWTGMIITRSDGTTTTVPNGSVAVTGLSASTTYYFYPYYDDTLGILTFVAGGVGSSSLGAIAQTAPSLALGQQQGLAQHVPLSTGNMPAATTASGGGGGSGGGAGPCVRHNMLVETRSGTRKISDVIVGEEIFGPAEWTKVVRNDLTPHSVFVRIELEDGEALEVTATHPLQAYTVTGQSVDVRAKDITLSHLLPTRRGVSPVRRLEVIVDQQAKKSIVTCEPSPLFYAGERAPTIQAHNVRPDQS